MEKNYIEFKKKRELGDIISDSFTFLRQNLKEIFLLLIKTSTTAIILLIISLVFMTYIVTGFTNHIGVDINKNLESFNFGIMAIAVILLFIGLFIFYGVLFGTILHYIKSYIDNQGSVNIIAVQEGVKNDFWKIIGLSMLSGIIVWFGLILCFFPGVYFYVPMSLVFSILIFRNVGTFDAIGESFELIKNEWWITFATLLVISIIGVIIGAVFALPAFMYSLIKTLTVASEGSMSELSGMVDWIAIILSVIGDLVRYFVIYVLTAVSSAFIYYNLNERKHHTGALEQIDSLGKSE